MTTTISPEGIAQILNTHHHKTGAGFYAMGRHFFAARAIEGRLEVYDFTQWQTVPAEMMQFHDHHSLTISLFDHPTMNDANSNAQLLAALRQPAKQPDPRPAPLDVAKAVRILNAHHRRTCAGFYCSILGGRYFEARSRQGILEVFDFGQWFPVPADKAKFHDHNGQDIPLS